MTALAPMAPFSILQKAREGEGAKSDTFAIGAVLFASKGFDGRPPEPSITAQLRNHAMPESVIYSIAAYRLHEAGFQDRSNGLPPQESDPAYLVGYCERITEENAHDAALERDGAA